MNACSCRGVGPPRTPAPELHPLVLARRVGNGDWNAASAGIRVVAAQRAIGRGAATRAEPWSPDTPVGSAAAAPRGGLLLHDGHHALAPPGSDDWSLRSPCECAETAEGDAVSKTPFESKEQAEKYIRNNPKNILATLGPGARERCLAAAAGLSPTCPRGCPPCENIRQSEPACEIQLERRGTAKAPKYHAKVVCTSSVWGSCTGAASA